MHYLDDFLTLGPSGSPECDNNMSTMITVCDEAGLLVEQSKTVSPTAVISFLGMELDSNKGVVRLPDDKLHDPKAQLWIWHNKRACKKCELLSLLGILNHAYKAVRAGRSFLCRLIDVSATAKQLDHFIQLNEEAKFDISGIGLLNLGMGSQCCPCSTVSVQQLSSLVKHRYRYQYRYRCYFGLVSVRLQMPDTNRYFYGII